MDPDLEYWPLAVILALLASGIGALVLLRRQVNRESGDDEARTARALHTARKAAAGKSRDRRPRGWARAQMQIVMLLAEAAGRTRDDVQFHEVLRLLDDIEPVLESEGLRAEWATAVYYRGRAEWGLAAAEPGTAGLETAVATFDRLLPLKPWPRHLSRAIVVTLPAVILIDIGERKGDPAIMERAVALCREAVQSARRRIAVEWSVAYRNLSVCLGMLGRRTVDAACLEEAAAMAREAEAILSPRGHPEQRIIALASLGHALAALGDLRGDTDILDEAIATLQRARAIDAPEQRVGAKFMVLQSLGGTRTSLGRLKRDPALPRRAVEDLRAALDGFIRIGVRFSQAETARMLGDAFALLWAIDADPDDRRQAASQYRFALDIFAAAGAATHIAETEAALDRLDGGTDIADPAGLQFTPFYVVR